MTSMSLRVLISVVRFQVGRTFGAETYLRALLRALEKVGSDFEIIVLGSPKTLQWVQDVAPKLRSETSSSFFAGVVGKVMEGMAVGKAVRRLRPDVVFFPFNLMPSVRVPSVLMVHDLVSCFYRKNFPFYRPVRNHILCTLVQRSISRASVIVAPTIAVADEIRAYPDGKEAKIVSIPEAAEPCIASNSNSSSIPNWEEPFVLLQTGSKLPHKRQDVGIRAFLDLHSFSPMLAKKVRLVITGCTSKDKDMLKRLIIDRAIRSRVTLLGKVSSADLEMLISRATILLFPTFYEGFGLGIVEAQLRGKAVVVSDIPVLREVSGGYAEFFPPGNSAAMAQAVLGILRDSDRRKTLACSGQQHARNWTWEQHARKLLDVFRGVEAL